MNNFELLVLGNDYIKTTKFIEKIVLNTRANKDQEHMKMNIIINNKLLEKNNGELLTIINNIEKSNSSLICLCFDDEKIYNIISESTNIKILNKDFKDPDNLVFDILNIFYGDDVL